MLVDALREDFVEFNDESNDIKKDLSSKKMKRKAHHFLDNSKTLYKGRKMDVFSNLMEEQPENAILLPMEAEMPTVTTVRVKSIMTGSMSSVIETGEFFMHESVPEDNILYQVKNFIPESI